MADVSRLFTADEANALLPTLLPVVRRLRTSATLTRRSTAVLVAFNEHAERVGGAMPGPREQEARRRLEAAESVLRAALGELEGHGVWVKDAERGLLDFPSERDGEVVELCWLAGEERVGHWHRVGEGFARRRPL